MIKLPSAYQPGDKVSVHDKDGFLYNGVVEAVRFTCDKVFYEVIHNRLLVRDIKSEFVKDPQ